MARQGLTTEKDIEKMHQEIYNAENNVVDKAGQKKRRKKTIDIIVMSLCVVLTLVFVFTTVSKKQEGEATAIFGLYFFNVETASMEPTIMVGETIVSRKLRDDMTISEGDVITFKNKSNQRVTHRVVAIIIEDGKVKYQTKGDNKVNSIDPDLLVRSDIEGIYWFTLPSLFKGNSTEGGV